MQGFAIIVDKNGDAARERRARARPPSASASSATADLSTLHVVEGTRARAAPNQIVIDKGSADDAGYKLGDTVPVITKAGRADYTLTRHREVRRQQQPARRDHRRLHARHRDDVLLGTPGTVRQSIDVKADSGVSQDEVVAQHPRRARRASRGAENVEVISGDDDHHREPDDLKDNLSFFNTFLLVFGVIALLVGSFIIFNTFSIIVAQRSRELALLRAIGAGQRQVLGSVLFEAVLVGLVASIIGLRRPASSSPPGSRPCSRALGHRHPGERHRRSPPPRSSGRS